MRIKADDVFSKPHRMIYETSSNSLLTHGRRIHLSAETRVTPFGFARGHGFCNTTLGGRTRKEFVAAYIAFLFIILSFPAILTHTQMDLRSCLRSYEL
ncbi:hypothetical protein CDAR_269971 [Caerostris darwini]|uniref:Uncharacterized protein n=1 Tax=Caerostris darwini TaxID=1538125 RepID=A0AAV4RLF6_9ARAC|nr:hypothetical protein CDAR_269971 [Caerostris darwini]